MNLINVLVTLLCFLTIVALVLYDYYKNSRWHIAKCLCSMTKHIRENHNADFDSIEDAFLLERVNEFLCDETEFKDIADYINIESINNYIQKDITDTYSGAFTGIGILGTFLGLVIGLVGFKTGDVSGGDMSTMATSIPELLSGIKTAFLTSIFGIVASVVFNRIYKSQLIIIERELENFYSAYYDEIEYSREARYEEKITNALVEMPISISETFISENFKSTLSEAVRSSLEPTMQGLQKETTGFIKKSVEAQKDILKMLVEGFMAELSLKLNSQFDNLANSIESLCQWQNSTSEKLSAVFSVIEGISESLDSTANRQVEIDRLMRNYLDSLVAQVDTVHKFTDRTMAVAERTENVSINLDKAISKESETLTKIEGFNLDVSQMVAMVKSVSENQIAFQNEMSQNLSKALENIRSVTEEELLQQNKFISQLQESLQIDTSKIDSYTDSLQSMSENINLCFERSSKDLSLLSAKLGAVIEDFNSLIDNASNNETTVIY